MFPFEPLMDPDHQIIWSEFYDRFRFTPSVRESDWPGIQEPRPSLTYRLRELSSIDEEEAHAWGLSILRSVFPKGTRLAALDWQHDGHWFDVHHPDVLEDWSRVIPLLPNGDYYIFLSPDLSEGFFGHPWEWTWCAFGTKIVEAVRADPPPFVQGLLRVDGRSV